ncbi:MAG: pitrilysin family protein [Bacteroidetes bacterium]|jgi:predicted Zn-dependent peptidase|nr:pitrilysin family protein [Bacteroidota bacterium]
MKFEFHTFTLPNGLRVIHKEVPRSASHIALVVNAGSRDELSGEAGVAHFIEHCLFKGTKKRKTFHILNRLERVGGDLNAYTTKEETWISASFLERDLDRAIELVSDISFNSTFPEKEIAKEQEVILDEIASVLDNPSDVIFDEFEERLFGAHPLGRTILGTQESVNNLGKLQINSFVERYYCPDQMVFASVGSTPISKLKKLCEKYLSQEVGRISKLNRLVPKAISIFDERVEQDTHQVHHLLGGITVGADHPDKLPLTLLANYLGGPAMNCRLSLNIREKYGMAYHIEAGYSPYQDSGVFSVYFGTDRRHHDKVEALVDKELMLLCNTKLGVRQLHDAKTQLIGQIALSQDSGPAMMTGLAKSFLLYNKVQPLDDFFKSIEKISSDDLLRVANQFIKPDLLSRLVYLDKN